MACADGCYLETSWRFVLLAAATFVEDMLLVGLTGGIATGKSTVSRYLREKGIAVIDADKAARTVVEPGQPAYAKLRAEFGSQYFSDEDGRPGPLIREKLAEAIFDDHEKRRRLNSITHPEVFKEMMRGVVRSFFRGERYVVLDVPLLIETGMHRFMNKVVVVHCTEETQLQRLMARDDINGLEAKARIDSQMPIHEKCERATHLIDNNGPVDATEQQVDRLLSELNDSWTPLLLRAGLVATVLALICLIARLLF